MSRARDHHRPCPCGAELADECPRCASSNPLGSMRIVQPYRPGDEPLVHDRDFKGGLETIRAVLKQWGKG